MPPCDLGLLCVLSAPAGLWPVFSIWRLACHSAAWETPDPGRESVPGCNVMRSAASLCAALAAADPLPAPALVFLHDFTCPPALGS